MRTPAVQASATKKLHDRRMRRQRSSRNFSQAIKNVHMLFSALSKTDIAFHR
ncbi:hypothetical protein CPter291_2916 [Collimonas pratensis]|uniref:Transposase n=1 Tax=Collimonas pratensis TaxID=279113 RepID=A0ABM5Z7H3_9BURK|nr:hypothetical protein CPter291_2916 [Collimonas pratensis]